MVEKTLGCVISELLDGLNIARKRLYGDLVITGSRIM